MEETKKNPCPEFPHFGAHYPDACCIDGFLWDLDSCDSSNDNGTVVLTYGGEDPCPFCNTEAYLEWVVDEENSREDVLKYIEQLKERYGAS